MKKSELKALIREVIQEVRSGEDYRTETKQAYQDGTEIRIKGTEVVAVKYKDEDLDMTNWKDEGDSNYWKQGYYTSNIAPKIKGKKGYPVYLDKYGKQRVNVYPEAGISYFEDFSD